MKISIMMKYMVYTCMLHIYISAILSLVQTFVIITINASFFQVFYTFVPIQQISCGNNFSAFLTTTGLLYTCGDGRYGRLGQGKDYTNTMNTVPKLVKFQPVEKQARKSQKNQADYEHINVKQRV